jgi:hypothetical protein
LPFIITGFPFARFRKSSWILVLIIFAFCSLVKDFLIYPGRKILVREAFCFLGRSVFLYTSSIAATPKLFISRVPIPAKFVVNTGVVVGTNELVS